MTVDFIYEQGNVLGSIFRRGTFPISRIAVVP